jgi:hypothetical protein
MEQTQSASVESTTGKESIDLIERSKDGTEPSAKWDFVMMFGDAKPPVDKEGNQFPEDHSKTKKFREVEKERKKVIKALQKPTAGLTIARKRSSDGQSMFVLITASVERLQEQAELVCLLMKLKEENGGGYSPFTVKHKHLFEVSDEGFFRKLQRIQLIEQILEADVERGGCGLKMDKLNKGGVITRLFPLHVHKKRKELVREWAKPGNWKKAQPLNNIRNYFGEEITLYFAWLGFYTQWLWYATIAGTVCSFFWIVNYFDESIRWTLWAVTVYSVFLALWATMFLEYWKRRNNELVFEWGVEEYESVERERIEYYGDAKTGVYSEGVWIELDSTKNYGFPLPPGAKYYSSIRRRAKMMVTVPSAIAMVSAVIVGTFAVLAFRLFCQLKVHPLFGSIAGAVANAVFIIVMNTIWKMFAVKLNEWENHRTQSDFDNNLIVKIFIFYFVNSYTSLFYIAFFKGNSRIFAQQDRCKTGRQPSELGSISYGCIDELTFQLVVILLVNMFIGQSKEVALPWIMGKIKLYFLKKKVGKQAVLPQWETEAKKGEFPGTFDEYSEMVIQYGYITMFACAFPLAPLLAVLNNVVEIRTDALKLVSAHSRPKYRGAQNIGTWFAILELLGVFAVITNCLLIGFSLSSIADLFGTRDAAGRYDFAVAFRTFAAIVVMEHILFAIKYLVSYAIPDVPGWIKKEVAKREWIKEMLMRQVDKFEPTVWPVARDPEDEVSDDEDETGTVLKKKESEEAKTDLVV